MSKKICYLVSIIIHVVIVGAYVRIGSIKHIGTGHSIIIVKVVSRAPCEENQKEVNKSKSIKRFQTKAIKHVRKSLSKKKIFMKAKRESLKIVRARKKVGNEKPASKSGDSSEELETTSEKGKEETKPGLGLSLPLVEKRVIPEYPYIARKRRYEGRVVLRALVDGKGEVKKIVVVKSSGYLVLDKAAINALKKWHFVPARVSGRPVEAWVEVPFVFNLENYQ